MDAPYEILIKLGLEDATAWMAELDGSHLHTNGLAS